MNNKIEQIKDWNVWNILDELEKKSLSINEERVWEYVDNLSEDEKKRLTEKLNEDFKNLLAVKGIDFIAALNVKVKNPIWLEKSTTI
jgi:uncharacterized protein YcgI (DUF1989 family)